jgi:hypothetical protein
VSGRDVPHKIGPGDTLIIEPWLESPVDIKTDLIALTHSPVSIAIDPDKYIIKLVEKTIGMVLEWITLVTVGKAQGQVETAVAQWKIASGTSCR